ncbi:MAG: DUF1501 domain-containing protein [Betaproteobacteria bacterium]
MKSLPSPVRRRLLQALAGSGLLAMLERNCALAQGAMDYKALVCVFMVGGNDGENTLVRFDSAGYQTYAAVRPAASGVNLGQAELLPVQPESGGIAFGFHPACGPLQSLFNQKRLAVVSNVGMLAAPSTKQGLEALTTPRPANLFSHNDQMLAVQSGDHRGFTRMGWGGRMADRVEAMQPGTLFPALTSVSGLQTFVFGQTSVPLAVPPNPNFTLFASGNNQLQFDALRDATLREILAQEQTNVYDAVAQLLSEEGLGASSVVYPILQNPNSIVPSIFANSSGQVADQFRTVAQLIEGRAQTQVRRQIFFVQQNGYDTHGNQVSIQRALLDELSKGLATFQSALQALGVESQVTTFTMSDFGRTFKPAANAGTDHGWGNYAFVLGGAVKGGDFYGTLPTQALGGPDDLGTAGRWIPTTSIEQYGATLARWFGITEADLPYVFPNIGAFTNTKLGFMS